MAQVPYSPVPEVSLENRAAPGIRVDAPFAAFGGATAEATSRLGSALERSGDELFARAYALQQLNNEAEAREADTNYMIAAGQLHAEYNALQGMDRVKAFPKYAADLKAAREDIRGKLSNPMSQRMYDAQSMSTMGRSIFNGAGVAASAAKDYQKGSLTGQLSVDAKTVEDSPNDETLFREKLRRVDENAAALSGMEGFEKDNPHTIDMASKLKSQLALQRLTGLARNQPYEASKLFEEYKSKGLLYGHDVDVAEQRIQGFAQTTGVATIADNVLGKYRQPDGSYSKSFEVMQEEAKKQASEAWPNDPRIGVAAGAAFDRNYNQVKWARTQDDLEVKKKINEYIVKGVTDTAMLPADLTSRMSPQELKQFPAQANAYQHSLSVQTNKQRYDELLGMYNNNNAEFMNTNIYRVPGLSRANIDFFVGLQRKAAPNGDPRVGRAMNWLKGSVPQALDDLKVTGPNMNRDTHNQFVGALHSAIQGWQEEYGKPPSEKEVVESIYPSLLRQVAEPGWLWGTNQTSFFKSQIPKPILDQAERAKGSELSVPETEQLRNEYMRQQFNQFYKSTKQKFNDRFQP